MMWFITTFHPTSESTILDVGGTPRNWRYLDRKPQIVLLNVHEPDDIPLHHAEDIRHDMLPNMSYVVGDGRNVPYPDNAFDICFSNSVIEHLSTYENQAKFAKEARRVAKKLWVQTPARNFFVEPHLITPFVHFLPKSWQRHLLRNVTVWGLITRPSPEKVENFLQTVRLLDLKEMKKLFPDCEILEEKFLFLTKAYIAVKR